MESKDEDSDDFEYKSAFAALDELRLGDLKPFFKRQFLQDDTLFYVNTEDELKNILIKELGLPFGQGFKFSRFWFNKYHKRAEALATPTPETSQPQENLQDSVKCGQVTALKKAEKKEYINGSPSDLKSEDYATTEGPRESKQDSTGVQHDRSNQKCQSGHEVQSSSDARAKEGQENTTRVNTANEKALATKFGVDNERQNETSMVEGTSFSTGTMELNALLSVPVTLNKEANHQFSAKTGETKDRIKAKVVAGVESHEQSKKENITSSEERNLAWNESDSSIHGSERELTFKREDKTSDLIGGHNTLIDENGNILKGSVTRMMKTSASDLTVSDTAEQLISEECSGPEKMQSTKLVSSHDAKESSGTSLKQEITAASASQGIGTEEQNNLLETENYKEVSEPVLKCIPRPFGVKGKDTSYRKGFVLDAEENREVEFKSLASAQPSLLPWKIMDKAKKFICACLNADNKGIIYFGVGDCQEQNFKFKRGEILGLDVEDIIDDIMKAFQYVLDDHIKSDDGALKKGGDQNCVNIEFIPVTSEGERTKLYVVEIEVSRDWTLCKDNVYYSKCWTEKRGVKIEKDQSTKKLSDFYKVLKDEFADVAIRTSGASSSVKQHEVNRQVKEPLTAKYKEWKREAKLGTSESPEGPIPDDSDVKRFSTLVRERLRDLNFKDFGYILIANKLPPQYRRTPDLAFLQNIPWLAVFDLFDAASKKDGLHFVCNETTDAPRAKLRSLDDFKEVSSDWISGKDSTLPTRGTTWILNDEEMQKGDWIKCCRDCFYRALSAYKLCFPPGKILCVFLGLGDNAVQEMVDIMECCFSIFGNAASSCIAIISENKNLAEAFIKASKPSLQKDLKECSVAGIPWSLLKEIVRELVGPEKFEERGATTELPYFNGKLKEVLNKVIYSWNDLEVYSPNPRLPRLAEDIEKARNAFYKGAQASQTNLFHNHCIERTLEEDTNLKIDNALKSLSKPGKDLGCHVKSVTVLYEPGSGATTLCRRILWNKRKDYRCAVVKAVTPATDYQIEQLQGILYDDKNISFSPPVLVLVDNVPEKETKRLTENIVKRQTKCVILSTLPIGKSKINSDFDITPLRQLDEKEMRLVKDILINITSDSKRRRGAEEVLEREKRFIWFGLELFGRDYDKIEKRLQNHISSTLDVLDDSQEIHEMVLNFCCFLHYYSDGRVILPHPVASDFLYEASNETEENCALMKHIHKIFGGLLLEGFNETNGYYGWRPAHSLVSEVVKSRINIEDIAILLVETIHRGKAYVNKFLKEQVFNLFLERKRIRDTVVLEDLATDEGGVDSDFECEVVGFYEVRTRYSPLIMDILERDNDIRGALRLLVTICQKASQTEGMAYAWQQLARFMGYEMRAKTMDPSDELHHLLYTTMNGEEEVKLDMPKTGIEAAHVAVNIAINQQPKQSHHYVTKGFLYFLQLRDFKPEELLEIPSSLPAVIDICRKALDVYDKALKTTHRLNHYSMNGKIQAIVCLLEIVKGLPFFRPESDKFTRYLKKSEIPKEMKGVLTQEEHTYVQGLGTMTLDLLNELFRDVRLRQMTTYDENEIRVLSNAKIRASKLRRTFYEVTGFERSQLSDVDVPRPSSPLTRDTPALHQQIVQDILFKLDETPYSSWANLVEKDVSTIYNLLKPLCNRGYGSQDDLLICCKACLRLEKRPPVDELDKIVTKWVAKYPNSEWAHLFNYMIHFPTPKGSLAAFSNSAQLSIKKCDKIVRDKTGIGFRKSGAEYFLGKGIGLYAIVTSQEFRWLETKWETKTDFWRSREISEKLERVCGQKDVNFKGVITYQGIQLRFDETRYPYESKDDLWFYIGFSVAGPYAYDPVDNDTYDVLRRKSGESAMANFPASEVANPKDTIHRPVSRRGKLRELRKSITKRSQELKEAKPENIVLSGAFSSFPCSTPQRQAEKPISSSMPHFPNTEVSSCPENLTLLPNSTLSSSSKRLPGMSSWDSADNVHHPASSSRQVSCASALQLGPKKRKKQKKKVATKQKPVGTSNDSHRTPRLPKGKLRDVKYSTTKRSQKTDWGKVENLDALSDNLTSSPCSNPGLQAEKSISSSIMSHFLNVLASDCPNNPTVAPPSTLSSSYKRLPGVSSWDSVDNIHHPASSSRQVSSSSELQVNPTMREEQMTKVETKQEPVGTCVETHHTPNPPKEKLGDLQDSLRIRSQKPDEVKAEFRDALSDDFNGNPQLQAEKSISPSMPHFLNVWASDCPDNPTVAPKSTLSLSSKSLPGMSSLDSADNIQHPASSLRQVSSASDLQLKPTIREEQITKVATKQEPVGTCDDTHHTPNPPKGKLDDLQYSITKRREKPDEVKAEFRDALSDAFNGNPQLQAEKSISSSMPHFLNVWASDCPDNPTVAPKSTLSLSSKSLPGMSSLDSADNIQHPASSLRQVSSASDLQLKPTIREEQITKVATKQEPVGTCDDTHHTPNPPKGKLDDLQYSITKRREKPDEGKAEIRDGLSDDFNGNPQLQAEKSISSSMPHFLNVLPSNCLDNPTEAPNSTLFSSSTSFPTLVSADNLHHQASSSRQISYASALQLGPTIRVEQMAKDVTKQEPVRTCNDTYHTPKPRKGKLRHLKYSITKRSQTPDEGKAEILDALPDNFTGSPCNNPQLQAEKSISSSMPHILNVMPSDCPNNPTVAPKSTLSSSSKRFPGTSSWDSAHIIHYPASSSRQVSSSSDLQLKPTIREEQMTKVATKQELVGTCDDTHHTPNPRKGKSGDLKYSITKRSQKPDKGKAEILDALSDDVNGSSCSNSQLQAEKSISSSIPHFLNVLPSDCLDNPTKAPNSTMPSSAKRFPGMSSWNSADNIHHPAFSSRQVSYASALQLGPTMQEEQITKVATKQEPVGTCNNTHHTPNFRKGKLGDLKYSITKRSEKLDALSDDFNGSSCSNLQLQAEKSISSSMPHCLNKLPSDCLANPTLAPNPTLSSSSERFPGILSWDSADNLNHPPTLMRTVSYASALQRSSSRREEHITEAVTRQQPDEPYTLLPTNDRNWKKILGTKGNRKQLFQPRYLDEIGKLHHGSCVLGAEKSRECTRHTSQVCDIGVTSRCRFAHSWRGDTLQYVCTKCTRNNKDVCKEKINHEMYIWNLGPYYKEDGTIWKETPQ